MKRILILVVALILIFGIAHAAPYGILYPAAMQVIDIDPQEDAVYVVDFSGNVFAFFGIEDWDIGDLCACIMQDNNTPEIEDDVIVSALYAGWLEEGVFGGV